MLPVQVLLHHHPFAVEQLPEPSICMCCTSCPFHGSSCLRPSIPGVSICQAWSASTETSPGAVALFSELCPSHSRVHHLCSAGAALSHHHPQLNHPPYRQNLQDHPRLSPIATIISCMVFLGSLFINTEFSAFFLSSCSCWPAASACSTHFLAWAVYLST